MPFTVSCTACDSRFLLGDDLFRRKVSGNIVTVKCRNCDAEISLDARDIDTMPSHESPRKPQPPRPKAKTAPMPAPEAAPVLLTQVKPVSAAEASSIWDSDATVSISGKAPFAPNEDAEFVDFEEIPASSSDAPPLNALTHHDPVKPPRRNKPADDFLVNLSAGTGGILGAPTIDVSGLEEPAPVSFEEIIDVEPELSTQRTGAGSVSKGTVPLFDMSAVLPAANPAVKHGTSSAAPMQIDIDFGPATKSAPAPSGKVRERKFVVAPQDAPPTQKKRGGVVIWFAVAAVAAGVLAVVGLRGHRVPEPVVSEALPVATHAEPVATTPAPVETAAPAAEAPSAAEVASAEPSSSAAPIAATVAPTSTVKNTLVAKAEQPEQPKSEPAVAAVVTAEKPAETAAPVAPKAPVEIHNAPPAAAPGTEFDRSAAVAALKGAAAQASSCRKDGDPSGTAVLTITFAPSGRVTSAAIQGPPFAGTATGGCIASTMRHASIPAFDGDRVTVTKTVIIE